MLTASTLRRRIALQICDRHSPLLRRFYRNRRDGTQDDGAAGRIRLVKSHGSGRRVTREKATEEVEEVEESKEPSLYAQLFPDQEEEARRKQEREVPPIPLQSIRVPHEEQERRRRPIFKPSRTNDYEASMQYEEFNRGEETSVLVLRNASKNLVEEDFRRLIPQGQHMEGWTLEQGDILQVIPGRDLATLAQENYYYLLFKSALSAFTYQGHATRIHNIVAAHTPSSIISPMLPPPGYMLNGMDANSAIQSFSLVPPNQTLDLRQLKPPLSPMMQAIVRNKGYPDVVRRVGRMPYEVRLTLDGPQLHLSHIRHVLLISGQDRRLSWSGAERSLPSISKWQPVSQFYNPSPESRKEMARIWANKQEKRERLDEEARPSQQFLYEVENERVQTQTERQKRRTSQLVYVVGFRTEKAMQSFVRFWHGRPMDWEGIKRGGEDEEGDLAPVTNVEVLW